MVEPREDDNSVRTKEGMGGCSIGLEIQEPTTTPAGSLRLYTARSEIPATMFTSPAERLVGSC